METFYRTKFGIFPYHRKMGDEQTSVQHLHPYTGKEMAARIKQFSKIYKTIHCPHLIPLFRILREQQQFHMIYEYQDKSLNDYLPKHLHSQIKRIQQEISCALKCLEQAKVRVDIRIQNVTVTDEGKIKLFVMPDADDPLNQQDLQQFYTTEKTRLHFELQELWEQIKGPEDDADNKEQSSPGFIISGNKIVFTQNAKHSKAVSHQGSGKGSQKALQINNPDSSKNILGALYNTKQTQSSNKPKRYGPNQKQSEYQHSQKHEEKTITPSVRDTEQSDRPKATGLIKVNSSNEDLNLMKKPSQRNSAGNVNLFKPIEQKMTNSANPKSNNDRSNNSYQTDKSQSSYRDNQASRRSGENNRSGESDKEKRMLSAEDNKIQITTEMVSKYKMKIITCQQIQFEGMDGDNIQKLAQEKLGEYRKQHGYPQTAIQAQKEEQYKKSIPHQIKAQLHEASKGNHNQEEIMNKILMAKQKASTALKQYCKNRKKLP